MFTMEIKAIGYWSIGLISNYYAIIV